MNILIAEEWRRSRATESIKVPTYIFNFWFPPKQLQVVSIQDCKKEEKQVTWTNKVHPPSKSFSVKANTSSSSPHPPPPPPTQSFAKPLTPFASRRKLGPVAYGHAWSENWVEEFNRSLCLEPRTEGFRLYRHQLQTQDFYRQSIWMMIKLFLCHSAHSL